MTNFSTNIPNTGVVHPQGCFKFILISFSIVLKIKERLKLENNKLIRLNKYNIIEVWFDFDIESFCYGNFGVTFEEYIAYAPKKKLIIMAEALNNVYLSIAKIPTNLL